MGYDVFERDTAAAGGRLGLHGESYRALVIPPVEVIPYAAMAKAKEFFERGGVVAGCGYLPSKSATLGHGAAEIAALRDAVWGAGAQPGLAVCRTNAAGGRAYLLPELPTPEQFQQVLAEDAGVHPTLEVLAGQTDHWLHVLHRVKCGRDVFLVCNQNVGGGARTFRFRATAAGTPECWDAMRNEQRSLAFVRNGAAAEFALALEPLESVLVVFQPEARALPARPEGPVAAAGTVALTRDAAVAPSAPAVPEAPASAPKLEGCAWVWYPEGNAAAGAPPGVRCFRGAVSVPADRKVKAAHFVLSADNKFTLWVNGRKAGENGGGESWHEPVVVDIAALLHPGANTMATRAVNETDTPSPAGLIGRYTIAFEQGAAVTGAIGPEWKAFNQEPRGWREPGFDDQAWPAAHAVAKYGEGPWHKLGQGGGALTLSPVKADPFVGHGEIPADWNLTHGRVDLEMDELVPEEAARVTVNGKDAGGFLGRPLRLDVTRWVKPGANTVRIEPFAPKAARLVWRRP